MQRFRRKQQGASALTIIALIILAIIVGRFALTSGTDYMTYLTVRSIVNDIAVTQGAAARSPLQLREDFTRRLAINSVYANVTRDNLSFEQDGAGRHIIVTYEARRNFFLNIDVVTSFSHRATLSP